MSYPDPIPWLLSETVREAATPSIRYQTLRDLLNRPADEPRVTQARQAVSNHGPVPAILAQQTKTGAWFGERSYYTPKYTSTHWSLMLLVELGIEGQTPGFQRGVDYMLAATAGNLNRRVIGHTGGLACFWGNLLRYALLAGRTGDARVDNILHYLMLDLQDGCCCEHNYGTACAWGVARALWGLAALGQGHDRRIRRAVRQGVAFLLEAHDLAEVDYPVPGQSSVHTLWDKLNFPLFYQADRLFVLRVLGELGYLEHAGAQAALDWLEQRRGRDGRWSGVSPFRGRTWRELGDREETSRWVTLQALRILRQAGR